MADSDDSLARTATAPSTGAPGDPLAGTLGRYKIERELGAGGMGVVYGAFDPDLERRVALKVLATTSRDDASHKRLLREARAMARLAHPNVVTVHEVGSAAGRDYVAMELIDGESLADWLRDQPREPTAILDAFVAAGRGLAAAHKAGIVHRDFKPHNVLRDRSGRIVVTDFGLAREASDLDRATPHLGPPDPLATTMEPDSNPDGGSTPLAGVTITGSVLGTPAYMAPEQWRGASLTGATDQFAYCVALWEALAGERPFRGATANDLRAAVERGPHTLDDSKLPRALRTILRRGLDPDPDRRWPSMDALLAAMTPARGRPWMTASIGAIGAAALATTIAVGVTRNDGAATDPAACSAPAIDPAQLSLSGRPEQALLVREQHAWHTARATACKLPIIERGPVIGCLDAVAARLDVIASAVATLPANELHSDAASYVIAPAVCLAAAVPRLAKPSPAMRTVLTRVVADAALADRDPSGSVAALLANPEQLAGDACASALARAIAATRQTSDRERNAASALAVVEGCADDRVRAEVAIALADNALQSGFGGGSINNRVESAAAAVSRVRQPDLVAQIDVLRMSLAARSDDLPGAIARGEAAMREFDERHRTAARAVVALELLDLKTRQGRSDDHQRAAMLLELRREVVSDVGGEHHPTVRTIDRTRGWLAFEAGDLATARSLFERSYRPRAHLKSQPVGGVVVDSDGRPVAGARVTVGTSLIGYSEGAALQVSSDLRFATTDGAGRFAIVDAVEPATVIAERGDTRSHPAVAGPDVKLMLLATGRISGRVELGGASPAHVYVAVQRSDEARLQRRRLPYQILTPVAADGSFVVAGVPRERVSVFTGVRGASATRIQSTEIDARAPVTSGVVLTTAPGGRVVNIVVRSTVNVSVTNAQVLVLEGVHKSTTADKFDLRGNGIVSYIARQIDERAPPAVTAVARRGDMFVTVRDAPVGVASACAVGLPEDLSDPKLRATIYGNLEKLELRCVALAPTNDLAVVEVPPWPRL